MDFIASVCIGRRRGEGGENRMKKEWRKGKMAMVIHQHVYPYFLAD